MNYKKVSRSFVLVNPNMKSQRKQSTNVSKKCADSDFCRFWLLCTEDDSISGIETAVCAFFAHICALFTLAFHIWTNELVELQLNHIRKSF